MAQNNKSPYLHNHTTPHIDLTEAKTVGKAEEPAGLENMFKEEDSVEYIENPFTLSEEAGITAARAYFEKYQNFHAKDMENKINEMEMNDNIEASETKSLLKERVNTSNEIDKALRHLQ
eukprot:1237103-Ditylum_brightwellii.AAC.1